jgi:hypothetical protein
MMRLNIVSSIYVFKKGKMGPVPGWYLAAKEEKVVKSHNHHHHS